MSGQLSHQELSWQQRVGLFLLALALLGLFALAHQLQPDQRGYGTHEQLGLPPCLFQFSFGIPCPSCGGTTCFAHFVRGEWRSAAEANAAGFAVALLCSATIPWSIFCSCRGHLYGMHQPTMFVTWLLFAVSLFAAILWAYRIIMDS